MIDVEALAMKAAEDLCESSEILGVIVIVLGTNDKAGGGIAAKRRELTPNIVATAKLILDQMGENAKSQSERPALTVVKPGST
jgi:hypothetical protein